MAEIPQEKIVLDRKSFEALAVESRVRILKTLKERRKTLSEISQEMEMSASAVKEHLENLESAGLIVKIDDGHKWKYYELTQKGGNIVAPKELRVWILLSASTVALVASLMAIFFAYSGAGGELSGFQAEKAVPALAEAPEAAADFAMAAAPAPSPDLNIPALIAVISAVVLMVCIAMLLRNRSKPTSP